MAKQDLAELESQLEAIHKESNPEIYGTGIDTPKTEGKTEPPAPDKKPLEVPPPQQPVGVTKEEFEALKAELGTATQRYNVLQGKFNKEIGDLREENRGLKQEVQTLKTAPAAPAAGKTAVPSSEAMNRLTEALGKENLADLEILIDVKAEEKAAKVREELSGVTQKVDHVASSQKVLATETFEGKLAGLVPDWAAINASQEWMDWLDTVEPASGQTYRELGEGAFNNRNVVRAAAIFNLFKGSRKTPISTTPTPPPAAPGEGAEALLAPKTKRGSEAPTQEAPALTQEFINKFFSDVAKGLYRDRPKEREKIQASIDKALESASV